MDIYSPEKRSRIMSAVRAADTSPEMVVRRALHALGYRFRLHRRDLPGTPDIVLPRHRTAVFVHGCFWHHHQGCPKSRLPTTNTEFWQRKIADNVRRDRRRARQLRAMGWRVLTVWECQAHKPSLSPRLGRFLQPASGSG